MSETRMQFWHRRGRTLHQMRKAELCSLYRKLGGLGGIHPPEKWTKDEVVNAVVDMEWRRLPDDAKEAAPESQSMPCDTCGKGEGASAHAYGGSHNYNFTFDPNKQWQWVPYWEYCAAGGCGRPYEHHQTWNLGHQYQAPTEVQPATPVGATVFPSEAELADRIFGPGTAEKLAAKNAENTCCEGRSGLHTATCPDNQPAVREEWLERPSGPPARILVDGPGCTPASVPADPPDPEGCAKCKRPFDPSDTRWDGHARQNEMPFCRGCVSACHDTEIADHWCVIDQWRTDGQ